MPRRMASSLVWWLPLLLAALAWLAPARSGHAQRPAGAPSAVASGSAAAPTHPGGDGGPDAEPPAPPDPEAVALHEKAQRIGELVANKLEAGVDPVTLFDVPIGEPEAVALEARRLRSLLSAVDDALGSDAGLAAARALTVPLRGNPPVGAGDADGGGAGDGDTTPDGGPAADTTVVSDEVWEARVALDRARLAFYALAPAARQGLLDGHAERVRASKEAEQQQQLSGADQKAREAAADRQKALEAMRRARTEATRLVAEEQARLLGVKGELAEFEKELIPREHALEAEQETLLGWRRRVSELTEPGLGKRPEPDVVDRTYDELRRNLRRARQQLGEALRAVEGAPSAVPTAGPDPLVELAAEVDRSAVDSVRTAVLEAEQKLRARESTLRDALARQLMDEVEVLNRHRLALLPLLSTPKRDALVGFGAAGLDQAKAEGSQVVLVVRYHRWATISWAGNLLRPGQLGGSALGATAVTLSWLLPIAAFVWWRRRADRSIAAWGKLAQKAHEKRTHTRDPSRTARLLDFLGRIRSPLEWLLLLGAVFALLPDSVSSLLETEILREILAWTFGAMLVIYVVDALSRSNLPLSKTSDTGRLRLRSLRLVGLVIVVFALILRITSRLVGEGTIYSWVFSTCWFAAVPIALVLVAWWRPVVFERLARGRRKSAVAAWVGGRQAGWGSFPAAFVGASYLIGSGVSRALRGYVGRFDVTRRALAYWFRREVSKQAANRREALEFGRLPENAWQALHPETFSPTLVESVADEQVADIVKRIEAPGGGLFAVVGERGGGKSSILRRIAEKGPDVTFVRCPHGGLDALQIAIAEALGLPANASLADIRADLDRGSADNGLVIDDAHRLLRPQIGGLADFDALLAFAREASNSCTWVFGLDSVIWQLFERARGSRPLFDDVIALAAWSEQGIERLLDRRSKNAKIDPSFELVVTDLPDNADEVDREEALVRARAGYVRIIWDHAGGNPGVALQLWRESLRAGPDGRVLVRLFATPSTADLESLPDAAVFVLRAVVQLDLALADDVCSATMLPVAEVASTLRYGLTRGYFELVEGRYRVAWPWFRAITRLLQRRHLLASTTG